MVLDLSPGRLDGREDWGVGRQVEQLACTVSIASRTLGERWAPSRSQHQQVAGPQGRAEATLQERFKGPGIGGADKVQGRGQPLQAQGPHQRDHSPAV